MELEQIAKQLGLLAGKDSLTAPDHERARSLMKELRRMGMTNAQISELTGQRWAETTVKEYTRGVKAVDSQQLQSTTALLAEMLSRGLTTEDVKETIAVGDKLESGGTSLAEITELLIELKKADMDIGSLAPLYRQWKASGLTAPEVASALKYKDEIEGMGFGLDSLSDIAAVARDLGNPKDVLEAIGKYRNITELDNQVKATQGRLAEEEGRIEERIEAGEQAIREVQERQENAVDRLGKLNKEVSARADLLAKAEELEKLGANVEMLRHLKDALTEIGTKHGLKGKQAITKFFNDLQDYDAKVGFEREIQRLRTITGTKKLEVERWQAEADSLARRHKDLSEAITAVQSLIKHGVRTEQIMSWNAVVSRLGGPEQLQDKLGRYKSMSELLEAKGAEIENGSKKVTELGAQIKALNEQKAEIEGAIKALRDSGVRQIEKVSQQAAASLTSIRDTAVKETERIGSTALARLRAERDEALALLNEVVSRALAVGVQLGGVEERLAKVKGTKERIESFMKAIEAAK